MLAMPISYIILDKTVVGLGTGIDYHYTFNTLKEKERQKVREENLKKKK